MRPTVLRRPGVWAGIVLLQLALAALTYFFIFPALGVVDVGLYPIIFLFLVGTAVCLLVAAAAERSAGGLLLSDALDGLAAPAFVLDADGRFLAINPAAEKLLDLEPGSGTGNLPDPRLRQAVDAAAAASDTADAFAGGAVLALQGLPRQAVVFRLAGEAGSGESPRRLVFLRDASGQIAANGLAGEISQILSRLGENAAGIADTARNMSQGATRQAQSLSGITATMGDFAKKIQGNTESSEKGTQLAAQAREAAERSGNEIANALTAMTDVQDAGIRIARIVKLIDDIAFQTNLLALNAAVEAARAGRQGKGFAVVADEVRNLAGRSAKAAKDTASMVEDVTVRIGNASAYIAKLEEMLNNIVQDAVRMADSSVAATAKSAEQVNGILMVNSELGEISLATGSTITAADATTTSVEIMNSQVASLGQKMQELLTGLFRTGDGRGGRSGGRSGGRGGAAARRAAADRDWQTGGSMLTTARQPIGGDFSAGTSSTDLFGGGFGGGGATEEEEFEAPFKRLAAGERGWELGSAASTEAETDFFQQGGYAKQSNDIWPNANGNGAAGAAERRSLGDAETADGDRVVRPRQNIPLDDAEFGRY